MKRMIFVCTLLLTTIMFQVMLDKVDAIMSATRTLPNNTFSTGTHLFFSINLTAGTAKQPEAPAVPVLTGLNSTLSTADFGTISRPLIDIIDVKTVADVVKITNKSSSAKTISISVEDGSAPLLSNLSAVLKFPNSVTVNSGETISVDATMITNLLTGVGEYTGWIKFTDTATNLSYSIPAKLVVKLVLL
jgi:hypothetical protein